MHDFSPDVPTVPYAAGSLSGANSTADNGWGGGNSDTAFWCVQARVTQLQSVIPSCIRAAVGYKGCCCCSHVCLAGSWKVTHLRSSKCLRQIILRLWLRWSVFLRPVLQTPFLRPRVDCRTENASDRLPTASRAWFFPSHSSTTSGEKVCTSPLHSEPIVAATAAVFRSSHSCRQWRRQT